MPSRPWYKWYPADFLADTRLLSLEEKGAYRELLDALWTYGPLEDSDQVRGKLLGSYARTTARVWTKLKPFFVISGGKFDHPKLAEQRAELIELQGKRAAAGAKGGKAKALASAKQLHPNARDARAGPEPDRSKHTGSGLPVRDSRARPREGNGADPLTPDQRAEAERMNAELEQRRQSEGVEPAPGPRHILGGQDDGS